MYFEGSFFLVFYNSFQLNLTAQISTENWNKKMGNLYAEIFVA